MKLELITNERCVKIDVKVKSEIIRKRKIKIEKLRQVPMSTAST